MVDSERGAVGGTFGIKDSDPAGSTVPLVSVVMSVYNGADSLGATMDSLLSQESCALEVIVVDDGSTDRTAEVLARYSGQDSRVRVVRQDNAGLTAALIQGCALARGTFIARQDAEDVSMPGRFKVQSDYLLAHPEVSVVASGIRFVAPSGEWLYDMTPARHVLIELDVGRIKTPSLVAAMFRRDAYHRCGGFQKHFVVAQDVDLWLRLDEVGTCHGLPDVHYQARMTMGGISSRRRLTQNQLGALAIECAKLRRAGKPDAQLLAEFCPSPAPRHPMTALERARFNYFIACCLRAHDLAASRRYFCLALRDNPLHLKALINWVLSR